MRSKAAAVEVNACGLTDVGRLRKNNEDNFAICDLSTGESGVAAPAGSFRPGPLGMLFLVADGMGGEASGEVASEICVTTVPNRLRETLGSLAAVHEAGFVRSLCEALACANRRIFQMARESPLSHGMGTTATAAGLLGRRLFVGQVGDSRAYLFRHGKLVQLTRDQTFLNYLEDIGAGLPTDVQSESCRNILIQAVGTMASLDIKVTCAGVVRGDRVLLCSDGLYNMVKPPELEAIVARQDALPDRAKALIDAANANGGTDNITIILADLAGPGMPESGSEVQVEDFDGLHFEPET